MNKYPYSLLELDYSYDSLEPAISKNTMEFHHGKHLNGYTNNLNAALEGKKELQDKTLVEILSDEKLLNENPAIKNNGGGVFNHTLYFEALKKDVKISSYVQDLLVKYFKSVELFKEEFKKAGMTQFGSGWAYLVVDSNKDLKIVKTANQDTPLKDNLIPVLTVDVWEHAYYLDYQNRRDSSIDSYFTIINWDIVEKRLKKALA